MDRQVDRQIDRLIEGQIEKIYIHICAYTEKMMGMEINRQIQGELYRYVRQRFDEMNRSYVESTMTMLIC